MSSNYNDAENYCKDCDRSIYGNTTIAILTSKIMGCMSAGIASAIAR